MKNKLSRDFLLKHYVDKSKSCYKIAEECGVSYSKINYWLRKYHINARPKGGHNISTLTGKKFGYLTVLHQVKNNDRCHKTNAKWLCQCKCGKKKEIIGRSLMTGATRSCGCRLNSKMWKGYGNISKTYWNIVVKGASKRGLEFNITLKDAWEKFVRQKERCAISGLEIKIFSNYSDMRHNQTASLDRIDSSKGYVKSNIQWVHKRINIMKGNMSEKELLHLCEEIVNYSKSSQQGLDKVSQS